MRPGQLLRGLTTRASLLAASRPVRRRVLDVRREGLTFLGSDALLDLHRQMEDVERRGIEGIVVEAGCARGGSAIVLAQAKSQARPLYVYDVFGMIPPPSEKDGPDVHNRYRVIESGEAGDDYYGYERDLKEQVCSAFVRHRIVPGEHNVELIEGLYEDTLHPDGPIALAHIDCDWYESVMTCLVRVEPLLAPGGVMVIDDYYDWSGCRAAVDEYFAGREDEFEFRLASRLQIQRR